VLVINGVISLPVALLAYFFLPDTPGTAKPTWVFTARVSNDSNRIVRSKPNDTSAGH
jgi:hypothetical protein